MTSTISPPTFDHDDAPFNDVDVRLLDQDHGWRFTRHVGGTDDCPVIFRIVAFDLTTNMNEPTGAHGWVAGKDIVQWG